MCCTALLHTHTRRSSQRLFCLPLQRSRSQAFCRRNSVVYTTRPSLSNPFSAGGHNSLHPLPARFDAPRQEPEAYHVPRTHRKSALSAIRSFRALKAAHPCSPPARRLSHPWRQHAAFPCNAPASPARFNSLSGRLMCSVPNQPAPDTKSEIITHSHFRQIRGRQSDINFC